MWIGFPSVTLVPLKVRTGPDSTPYGERLSGPGVGIKTGVTCGRHRRETRITASVEGQ